MVRIMTLGNVDNTASYFKYKTSAPIHGIADNKALKRLKVELRTNASSVECNIRGGDHAYLVLVLNDTEYASISIAPPDFVDPTFPAALTIPVGIDQVTAFALCESYKEEKHLYYRCKNVKKHSSGTFKMI